MLAQALRAPVHTVSLLSGMRAMPTSALPGSPSVQLKWHHEPGTTPGYSHAVLDGQKSGESPGVQIQAVPCYVAVGLENSPWPVLFRIKILHFS